MRMEKNQNTRVLWHGGDYNPEQWLSMPEILEQDIERFREAGINTVSVGIFSWSKLEQKEGDYQLDWLEQIIDRLYENGISVILGTPSGARPHWLADRYPEVLRMNEKRERLLFGRRHNHCLTSPIYREKVRLIDTRLAERFGNHPAVRMWHISNEFGGDCHCPLCQEAFRKWLKERYGTVEALNEAWCTTFWSHTYDSFDQVESPSSLGEESIMALNLDWKRFVSDSTIDFMEQEILALRQAGAMQPATANLMYDFAGIDYGKMAEKMDVVSWDSYPLWYQTKLADTAEDTAFAHDLMRGLKRAPYLLMESSPGATNWQGVSKLKKPGMVLAASLQSIAHGADGALYFQMRQSRGAEEKFHAAVIDHYGGRDSRTFQEVCGVGRMLETLHKAAGTQTRAEAAVLYDWENRWALEGSFGPRNEGMHYLESTKKSHCALRRYGINVDVIDQHMSLERYRFVAAPMQYLFHEGFAERLRTYVEDGGILAMTYWSGVVDENDRAYLGKTPHSLTDMLGLRREEIDGLYDWEENHICQTQQKLAGMKESYSCKNLCELVRPFDAETLMVYGEDFYAGRPALLSHAYGNGNVYYICADAEQAFYDDLYRLILSEAGVKPILAGSIPEGIEVTSRESEEGELIFIQNFGEKEEEITLPDGRVLFGRADGKLAPMDNVVILAGRKG